MISFPTGIGINIPRAEFNKIPTSLIQEVSRWIEHVLSRISSPFRSAARSAASFFSQLPGQILLGLKRAGIWLLLSPIRLIGWLWRLSGLGPRLAKAGACVLKLLKWGAIGTAALVGIVIAGSVGRMLYVRYKTDLGSDAWHSDNMFRNYGTIPRSTRWTAPNSRAGSRNSQNYRGVNNQEAASDERRRREAEEAARRNREEERERNRRQQRESEVTARRKTLESISNNFVAWKKKTEAMMSDRAKIRSIPQPTSSPCNDSTCKERMARLEITFCTHNMKRLVDAYVEVNKLSIEERRRLLDQQKKMWHPDRFTRCSEDVKENVQQVAQELMKIMDGLK
ncbi:hypothetical protein F5X99DRAFT_389857 [Biscogniauxia marginata]|nr:hypothetical protein F5X99DRAFT_389857 [Biscogniauxia marginata]